MILIDNLHASVDGKQILKGLSLTINAGEVHAIMGPNGAGKSTLSYVLAGRAGYEVTGGSVTFLGQDLLAMAPHERAAAGVFLGLQYPVEIPGVSNLMFLRTALNAPRTLRGAWVTFGEHRACARALSRPTVFFRDNFNMYEMGYAQGLLLREIIPQVYTTFVAYVQAMVEADVHTRTPNIKHRIFVLNPSVADQEQQVDSIPSSGCSCGPRAARAGRGS